MLINDVAFVWPGLYLQEYLNSCAITISQVVTALLTSEHFNNLKMVHNIDVPKMLLVIFFQFFNQIALLTCKNVLYTY